MVRDGSESRSHESEKGLASPPFSPSANTLFRYVFYIVAGSALLGIASWYGFSRSDYLTGANVPVTQPVLFSHRHHAGELAIDCLYCHDTADTAAFAGIPSTETCMTCHSQLFTDSPMLAPIRESFATGDPVEWNRVHDLPEFVYFDHSIHVQKGVDCATCHGDVARMPLVSQQQPLYMDWCLDCHRDQTPSLYPHSLSEYDGQSPTKEPHPINPLTNCYTCHR